MRSMDLTSPYLSKLEQIWLVYISCLIMDSKLFYSVKITHNASIRYRYHLKSNFIFSDT